MKLIELKPEIVNKAEERPFIIFDCPVCLQHRIEVPLPPTPNAWQKIGDTFDSLTLTPSIAHKAFVYEDIDVDPTKGHTCESHFFITNGEIVNA